MTYECGSCGAGPYPARARRCDACGVVGSLREAAPPPEIKESEISSPGTPVSSSWRLEGAAGVHRIDPGTALGLGRASADAAVSELLRAFPNVSRIHLEVQVDASGVLQLRDRSSRGTWISIKGDEELQLPSGVWLPVTEAACTLRLGDDSEPEANAALQFCRIAR